MCLLCCGRTLAAYAVDNDIVGMNGAQRPPLSACIQESNTDVQYMQNTRQSAWSKLVSIHTGYLGVIVVDMEASVLCRNLVLSQNMFSDMCLVFRCV